MGANGLSPFPSALNLDKLGSMALREKHALWLRWNHWINFPLLSLMIWSGILIYWANPDYPPFFPDWVNTTFRFHHRLAEGMWTHFTIAWIFLANALCYVTYLVFSGHWRDLFPDRRAARELIPTVLDDLGIKPAQLTPGLFNAAQKFTYTGVILLGFLEVLTGFAIYKPVQLGLLTTLFGGYETARGIHFAITILFLAFFLVHILQVARAGWNAFRAMVAGFEVTHEK